MANDTPIADAIGGVMRDVLQEQRHVNAVLHGDVAMLHSEIAELRALVSRTISRLRSLEAGHSPVRVYGALDPEDGEAA
jgi:hypothetical protein